MFIDSVFWSAAAVLAYSHIGYPLLLWVWARYCVDKPPTGSADPEPYVSVLLVAYNEAAQMRARIENLLALDYPRNRLEIILASDGSSDGTVAAAAEYRTQGVRIVAFNQRRGKSAVLNELVPRCRGDIVLLADARQRFAADVLRKLTAHFIDPKVGAVSGELLLLAGSEDTAAGEGVGFYWKYEKFMRRNESRIDSTIGATGAIYAIRRDLFEVIPTGTLLDDVLIPMRIVRRGYRVRFEPAARAFDREAPPQLEFIRKVRTLAGNFQLFIQEPWLLNPFSNRLWLQTVSHKGLRLLTPLCLVVVLLANLLLLDKLFYCWTLGMQSALYAAAVGGYLLRNGSKTIRILQIPYVFCLLNWAVVIGFVRFVNGRQRVTWERVSAHKETSAE